MISASKKRKYCIGVPQHKIAVAFNISSQVTTSRRNASTRKQMHQDFLSPILKKDGAQRYLEKIDSAVSRHSGAEIKLKIYKLRVGSLEDTSYREKPDFLQEWEQFYLPDEMKMQVIGVLEDFPCGEDSAELVLMVCEDGNVFAYEDERLHLVASSLKELFESGVQFPGSKYYYRGQSFEDMTDHDWNQVKKSEEVMKKDKEHEDMLKSMKPTYLENLEFIKQRQQIDIDFTTWR